MILFEYSVPVRLKIENRWVDKEAGMYIEAKEDYDVPNEVIGQKFYYRWEDGTVSCVAVTRVSGEEGEKKMRRSIGIPPGYHWMIDSIIKYGGIYDAQEQYSMDQKNGDT